MKFSSETKIFIGIIAITALVIGVATFIMSQPSKPIAKEELIPITTPTRGTSDAQVWLVEFSDFQCPACKAFATVVDELATAHPDTLFVAYRHFPLPQHRYAQQTAIAAEAAGRQGKFWDMGTLLFANQSSMSPAKITELTQSLGLDMDMFASDSADPAITEKIRADAAYAERLGINATPTFYLNGVKLEVATPNDLKTKVENALQR